MSTHVQPHRFTELQVLGLGQCGAECQEGAAECRVLLRSGAVPRAQLCQDQSSSSGCKFQVGVDGDGGWGLNRSHFNLKTVGI